MIIESVVLPLAVSILGTLVTLTINHKLKHRKENHSKLTALYHELINIRMQYEWLAGKEFRGEEISLKEKVALDIDRFKPLDVLRLTDTPLTYKIVEAVLLDGMTYRWRMEQLDSVIDTLGYQVNTTYKLACREIDKKNLEYQAKQALDNGLLQKQ